MSFISVLVSIVLIMELGHISRGAKGMIKNHLLPEKSLPGIIPGYFVFIGGNFPQKQNKKLSCGRDQIVFREVFNKQLKHVMGRGNSSCSLIHPGAPGKVNSAG